MTAPTPDRRAIITEALRKIDDLTARLAIAEKASTEPIAVVGIGCRLPGGVNNADEFWTLLEEGGSGVIRVPADRWDADAYYSDDHTVPGTICNRNGGFLTSWQPDEFDAEFFNIAPREAAAIDPQQRLLLEVAWEALENAGINPQSIRGSQTGVFIGLTTNDYYHSVASKLRREQIDAYIPFGNAPNFAAGRLSYFLGARGPAVVLDSACSSSLVSIHLACESLRRRESDAALAAGVNLILSPENSIACSRFGMLSPDGTCKSFDADANGYVRSEGCGVVVLKRLEDAQRDGDTVLAVIRGSAVNQDGASSGQTVPNGPAQQALMRQALHAARLAPSEVDYIEAHGTGTPLGDPIELDALSEVYGDRDGSAPLVLGSVKTNLGHLESAAGVTGFIKTVLSVSRGHIPRQLHFTKLTPHAGPGASKFVIASEPMDWPDVGRPRRAAVSSFGVSGTNAHILIEQAPVTEPAANEPEPPVSTLVVSGRSAERIAATAGRLAEWLDGPDGTDLRLVDVAHTLNHHRARYPLFATVTAGDRRQAVEGLRALAGGYPAPGVVAPHGGGCGTGTVFVYSGQGSQWAGMGQRLLAEEPAFAAAVDELEPVFVAQVGFSLRQILESGEAVVGIDRIQPVLVGVQLALTALWRAYGVVPDAVIGHSMGEVTAAVVAGALSPADGLKVIATRSRLMSRLSGQGAMALLELSGAAAEELLAGYPEVTVAVEASPHQVVIAGPPDQVDAVIAVVSAQDRLARRVDVDVASHHSIIDPVLGDLRTELADLSPRPPSIPVFVTTGGRSGGQERSDSGDGSGGQERSDSGSGSGSGTAAFDAEHWVANLRNPVRFTQAVAAAGAQHAVFVEVSPHPLLSYAVDQSLEGVHHHTLGTLQRDTNDTFTFHTNLNATHTVRPPEAPHPAEPRTALPTTPWHHTRHWLDVSAAPAERSVAAPATPRAGSDGDWFHQLTWPVCDLPAAGGESRWLVLGEGESAADLAALLGPDSRPLAVAELEAGEHDALRTSLTGADYVLYAPAALAGIDAAAGYRLFNSARRLLTVLAGMAEPPRLMILTRNAQPIEEGDRADPAHAVLWGMGRTIRLEHPEIWAGIVDVDESAPAELVARILAAEIHAGADDQAVYRRGLRHVPRLQRSPVPAVALTRFEGDSSHLVIGATGNVGPYLIRQLAEMGASTVVAVSRSGAGQLAELATELKALGTDLVETTADAADEAAMTALFKRFGADLPPLEGVYLAALSGSEALLTEMSDADVNTMFGSKLDAAAVLHRLTLRTPVRRFVLFSSITGLLGSRWLGHYTAANTFLGALAYARRTLGLAATVIEWGLWKTWADEQPTTKSAGLQPMPNEIAIRMMPAVLSPDAGVQSVVAGADWQRLADAYRMRAPLPIIDYLLPGGDAADIGAVPPPVFGTLLGEPVDTGGTGRRTWRAALLPDAKPYPGGHRVRGVEVVPFSVLLQTLTAAAAQSDAPALGDVRFEYPVVAEAPRVIHVVSSVDGVGDSITISSSPGPDTPADRWIRHCSARIIPALAAEAATTGNPEAPEVTWDPAAIAELERISGVEGRPFEWAVTSSEPVPGGLRADVHVPDASVVALVDAAVHLARLLDGSESLMLPAALEGVVVAVGGSEGRASDAVVDVRRRSAPDGDLVVDLTARAADGSPCIDIRGLRYAQVDSVPTGADAGPAAAPVDVPEWSQMTAGQVVEELRIRLRAILARELGMPEAAVDFDRPFPELGLDSMMAMTLLRDAKALVQMELSSTMLWNHPTLASFAQHVAGLLTPEPEPEAQTAEEMTDDSFSVLDALFDSVESTTAEGTGFEGSLEGEAR
ncbi:MAG: type I polyketide synthase [Mycobacteriaceae bacterium]